MKQLKKGCSKVTHDNYTKVRVAEVLDAADSRSAGSDTVPAQVSPMVPLFVRSFSN